MEGFSRFKKMNRDELKTVERGTLAIIRNMDDEERPFNTNAEKAYKRWWSQLDAIREELASREDPPKVKRGGQCSSRPRIKRAVRPIHSKDFAHIDGVACLF